MWLCGQAHFAKIRFLKINQFPCNFAKYNGIETTYTVCYVVQFSLYQWPVSLIVQRPKYIVTIKTEQTFYPKHDATFARDKYMYIKTLPNVNDYIFHCFYLGSTC